MRRYLTLLLLFALALPAAALERNVASQKVAVFAYDTGGAGRPGKTGDAAQITAYFSLDGGTTFQTIDANPVELDATNQPGLYLFDLATSETNAMLVCISAVSSTADIEIQPLTIYTVETMRGTDSAALAATALTDTTWTDARAGYVDELAAANLPADIDEIKTTVTLTLADTGTDGVVIATDAVDADALATDAVDEIADGVADEVLTGATHNVANSLGRIIRELREADYEHGAVWINTTSGTAGVVLGENGTSNNPSDNMTDANTLAGLTSSSCFVVAPGSSLTLTASQENQSFKSEGEWTLALGGQSISGSSFSGANITGIASGANSPQFDHCHFNGATLPPSHLWRCGFGTTITAASAGSFFFTNCSSEVAGTGAPGFDFGAAIGTTNLNIRNFSGGMRLENMGDAGTDVASIEGRGQIIEGPSCTGGTVAVRGLFTVSNITNLTLSDDARYDQTQILDAVIDDATRIDASQLNTHAAITPATVGAAMTLADDAITAAKYDESTAFPIILADTGSNQIARTGADGDTLETLSDQIDGVGGGGDATAANQLLMMGTGFTSATDALVAIRDRGDAAWVTGGSGTGSETTTYTITISGVPISGVEISLYTGVAKTGLIGVQHTDDFGRTVWELNTGTYYAWRKKAGYTWTNPDTQTVP